MITRTICRAGLQLLCLCVLGLYLTAAKVKADDACEDQAAACADKCGTTYSATYQYTYWDPYDHWGLYWDDFENDWVEGWIGAYRDHYSYSFGSGVESWSCDEGTNGGTGFCQCRY